MRTVALPFLLAALAGCGGSSDSNLVPYGDLQQASEEVHAFQPLEVARERLQTKVGAPHKQDDAAMHWYSRGPEGGCVALVVPIMGDSIGTPSVDPSDCP